MFREPIKNDDEQHIRDLIDHLNNLGCFSSIRLQSRIKAIINFNNYLFDNDISLDIPIPDYILNDKEKYTQILNNDEIKVNNIINSIIEKYNYIQKNV